MTDPAITIDDVERLDVRPGELLIVWVPRGTTFEEAAMIRTIFAAKVPDGVRTVVLTEGMRLQVVTATRDETS